MSVIGLILFAHGAAHLVGLGSISNAGPHQNWNLNSRYFKGGAVARLSEPAGVVLFATCALGFMAAGLAWSGTIISNHWIRPLTDGSAVLSTITLITFTRAFPPEFRYNIMAFGINALILANWLQIVDWPI